MKIRNVAHKGLRRFIERDDASGLPAAFVGKIRNILSFLQDMGDVEELKDVPSWRVHQMTGDRKGAWSLTVTSQLPIRRWGASPSASMRKTAPSLIWTMRTITRSAA